LTILVVHTTFWEIVEITMSMYACISITEECRVDALQETDNGNQDQIRITSPLTLNAFMSFFTLVSLNIASTCVAKQADIPSIELESNSVEYSGESILEIVLQPVLKLLHVPRSRS
jgi:hypothetical protein